MTNSFCPRLSHQLSCSYNENGLTVQPCCRFKEYTVVKDIEEFNKARDLFSKITGWTENCEFCKKQEDAGIISYRQDAFKQFSKDLKDREIVSLWLNLDQKCNAACLSCDSNSSSMWAAFNKKHNLISNKMGIPSTLNIETMMSYTTPDVGSTFREILFSGGEPFYSGAHKDWLKMLIKNTDASKINVTYVTNGSIIPDNEVIELWKYFNSISLLISVDGIGDKFHYLRWPLKWEKFERVISSLLELEKVPFISFNYTLGVMNLLSIYEIEEWIKNNFIPKYPHSNNIDQILCINPCREIIGLDKITESMRQEYLSSKNLNLEVSKLLSSINPIYRSVPIDTLNYINKIDQLRKLNWQTTFPELIPFLR